LVGTALSCGAEKTLFAHRALWPVLPWIKTLVFFGGGLMYKRHADQHGPWPLPAVHAGLQGRREQAGKARWEALGVSQDALLEAPAEVARLRNLKRDIVEPEQAQLQRIVQALNALQAQWSKHAVADLEAGDAQRVLRRLSEASPSMHLELTERAAALTQVLQQMLQNPKTFVGVVKCCVASACLRDFVVRTPVLLATWADKAKAYRDPLLGELLHEAVDKQAWGSLAAMAPARLEQFMPVPDGRGIPLRRQLRAAMLANLEKTDTGTPSAPEPMLDLLAAASELPPEAELSDLRAKASEKWAALCREARDKRQWSQAVGLLQVGSKAAFLSDALVAGEVAKKTLLQSAEAGDSSVAACVADLPLESAGWRAVRSHAADILTKVRRQR
jgi:hypothetical protein